MRLTIVLFVLLLFSFTPIVFAQEPASILLADYEWVHITIGDVPTESIRFDKIGADIQLYFYSFNDSSTIYDQFVIYSNQSFSDPLNLLLIHWDGTITTDNKILLNLQSVTLESVQIVPTKFEAEKPTIGHPPMAYVKPVITLATDEVQEIYDVLLDGEWLVSFDWTWAIIENQTLPQLRLYTCDGVMGDIRLITAEMKPLVDYGGVDGVGWILQSLNSQYAKWLLYSGHQITVRPNVGFGYGKPLPYFSVNPAEPKVEPNQLITIRFKLPQGVSNYTTNLVEYGKYLCVGSLTGYPWTAEYDSQTQEYTVSFSFNNEAVGKYFTIGIQAIKHGVTYLSETRIQVRQQVWQSLLWTIGAAAAVIIIMSLILLIIVKTRRGKPSPTEAVGMV